MKNASQFLLILAIACLVSSCSSFVSEKMLRIKKGSTIAEVYKFDKDILEKEAIVITNDALDKGTVYHLIVSEISAADNDNIWIYAFKNNQLFYWGYPYQFKRHANKEIQAFGEAAGEYLVKKEYLQATKE